MTDNELTWYINRYRTMLYRIAYNATLNKADSEDIVQESFFRLYTSHKNFDDESAKAWLIRVTINLSKNRNKLFSIRNRMDLDENIPGECISDDSIVLKEALKQLPQKYRIVIYLHYFEGYQSSEIAKLLGISTSAVTTRLQRGRDKLKLFLDEGI